MLLSRCPADPRRDVREIPPHLQHFFKVWRSGGDAADSTLPLRSGDFPGKILKDESSIAPFPFSDSFASAVKGCKSFRRGGCGGRKGLKWSQWWRCTARGLSAAPAAAAGWKQLFLQEHTAPWTGAQPLSPKSCAEAFRRAFRFSAPASLRLTFTPINRPVYCFSRPLV